MRILLLDTENFDSIYIKHCLEEKGHYVNCVSDGEIACNFLFENFDIYLLNIDVPNVSGLDILDHIKSININTIVIILSDNPSTELMKKAYELGCDDFIIKPFNCDELVAKITRINNNSKIKLINGIIYDSVNKKIKYKEKEIILTKNELKLFHLLITNLEICIQKDQIISYIYENKFIDGNLEFNNKATIRTLVYRLRKKLPENTIETFSNKDGYCINQKSI